MPWYAQGAVQYGLSVLQYYINKSKLSQARKDSFNNVLMVSLREYVTELGNPA